MLKKVRTSVTDAERSGRPSTSSSGDELEEAMAVILEDRKVTTAKMAQMLHAM
jgi:hypothetical protein